MPDLVHKHKKQENVILKDPFMLCSESLKKMPLTRYDKDASINPHATNKVPTDGLEIFFSVGQIFILKKKRRWASCREKRKSPRDLWLSRLG